MKIRVYIIFILYYDWHIIHINTDVTNECEQQQSVGILSVSHFLSHCRCLYSILRSVLVYNNVIRWNVHTLSLTLVPTSEAHVPHSVCASV